MHVEWKTVTDNPQLTIKLTLSPRKVEIPACRSLIYSCKAKISAWKFKKTVTNNVVSGSSGSGDRLLWELRDESVKAFAKICCACNTSPKLALRTSVTASHVTCIFHVVLGELSVQLTLPCCPTVLLMLYFTLLMKNIN